MCHGEKNFPDRKRNTHLGFNQRAPWWSRIPKRGGLKQTPRSINTGAPPGGGENTPSYGDGTPALLMREPCVSNGRVYKRTRKPRALKDLINAERAYFIEGLETTTSGVTTKRKAPTSQMLHRQLPHAGLSHTHRGTQPIYRQSHQPSVKIPTRRSSGETTPAAAPKILWASTHPPTQWGGSPPPGQNPPEGYNDRTPSTHYRDAREPRNEPQPARRALPDTTQAATTNHQSKITMHARHGGGGEAGEPPQGFSRRASTGATARKNERSGASTTETPRRPAETTRAPQHVTVEHADAKATAPTSSTPRARYTC